MSTATTNSATGRHGPYHVFDASFEGPDAEGVYGGAPPGGDYADTYMPDDVTRDCARRMHYAAWRVRQAHAPREAGRWRQRYYDCRDRVVLGNRKLVYRAVARWGAAASYADDLAGECQVVLIQAVAAYNPWLGVRFSTYAFTCLMRALSRLTQRRAADRLARWLPLDVLAEGEPRDAADGDAPAPRGPRLDEYLSDGNPLLTAREKAILIMRFCLDDQPPGSGTLEQVGRALGLSKERVRQVQLSALGKLRQALLGGAAAS